jgi:ABC-type polysaccharide/polyol phosphate transport system ATPase subunit
MTPILEVEGVAKTFRIPSVRRDTVREHVFGALRPRRFQQIEVLRDVSFEVRRGETLGIMGRNGSGKSTLLRIICGVYPPDRGTVCRDAPITPILELGAGWNSELDAIDNVYLIGTVMGMTLGEIRRDLDEILAFAELERFANLELKHFSSGMASRLAYSVAFHVAHELLVLDEIFAVGDEVFKERCVERQRSLRSAGCTTIMVSHDRSVISQQCERALVLDGGEIVFDGKASDAVDAYIRILRAS